jgi:hypothetical protein
MILELLQRVTIELEAAEIPYMVSGSIAMITYTVPRMTRDIDIVIELELKDLEKFCAIFETGYYLNIDTVQEEIKRRGMFNAIDHKSGYKIDFMIKKNLDFRRVEFERRIRTKAFGFDVWMVSIEDLIISKVIWIQELQSDRQIEDIRNLLTNPDIDFKYLTNWIERLNLNTFGIKMQPHE